MVRHKAQDPYDLAIAALQSAPENPLVVFVGPACRTWYADIDRLQMIMSDLYEARAYTAIHGGKFPFDMYVESHAKALGVPHVLVGPASRRIRLSIRYERDADISAGACLVVAFPAEEALDETGRRTKKYPSESADLDAIRGARSGGVPVLAVYRDGSALWETT